LLREESFNMIMFNTVISDGGVTASLAIFLMFSELPIHRVIRFNRYSELLHHRRAIRLNRRRELPHHR
jgi:hypothetical protein